MPTLHVILCYYYHNEGQKAYPTGENTMNAQDIIYYLLVSRELPLDLAIVALELKGLHYAMGWSASDVEDAMAELVSRQ